MIDIYFLSHYIMYKYYRKHGEEQSIALIRACCIHGIFVGSFIIEVIWLIDLFYDSDIDISKSAIVIFVILFLLFEYFLFYKGERYLEIFADYERMRDTEQMETKIKWAKIYNYSILLGEIIALILLDYCNKHPVLGDI